MISAREVVPVVVRFPIARPDASAAGGESVARLVARALEAQGMREAREASLVLAVNAPGASSVPSSLEPHRDVETHDRDLEAFVRALEEDARAGRTIALADMAYEGGPERALASLLDRASLSRKFVCHASGANAILEAVRALAAPRVDDEMREQPRVLERLIARPGWDELASRLRAACPEGAITVARGSSDHAASLFAYLAWVHLELPVASMPPSVATLYERHPRARQKLALAISQSGESPDVVRGLEALRAGGGHALAVTNAPASALARAAEDVVDLACGPERAVAATKTFTASLAALLALGLRWARKPELAAALDRTPEASARALEHDPGEAASALAAHESAFVLGRGFTLPLAHELALKLKEVARVRAEALSTHELAHGPRGSVEPGFPIIIIVPGHEPLRRGVLEIADSLKAQGARIVAIDTDAGLPDEVAAIPRAVRLQRVALAAARARGIDPDRPAHLEKVTRTW